MFDQHTSNTGIFNEILAIESRISELGLSKEVCTLWHEAGTPLKVKIGADTECYAYHRAYGGRIGTIQTKMADEELIEAVWATCRTELCTMPIMDSYALELNPTPGSATHIIKTVRELDRTVSALADQIGWDFAFGAGHWHLSIRDAEGIHLMNGNACQRYSPFAWQLASNVLALQTLCPALFLRPSRAEKDLLTVENTKKIDVIEGYGRSNTIQMNKEYYPYRAGPMFEVRMAHLAPYVPILMLLHAVERTLLGHKITANDYNADAVTLKRGDVFVRGRGCYLDYLNTTEKSGYLDSHFPHLRENLLTQCTQSYQNFLQTPAWSVMYDPKQREQALQVLHTKYPPNPQPVSQPSVRNRQRILANNLKAITV